MADRAELIDLSHVIEHGMITYRACRARISATSGRARLGRPLRRRLDLPDRPDRHGRQYRHLSRRPFHRYADGADLAALELARSPRCRRSSSAAVRDRAAVDAELFEGLDVAGKAVLVHTGWDRHWRTDAYFASHPFLTEAAARLLVERGARLVGIDSYNIDDRHAARGRSTPSCSAPAS